MVDRHKIFVSYHHSDENYRKKFDQMMNNDIVNCSVDLGDIDPDIKTEEIYRQIREYIKDASVIVVLIGKDTWRRKFVDWEIYSALRQTQSSHRCGLLGIFLPTYGLNTDNTYNPRTVPPRLYSNVKKGQEFGELITWTENSDWIKKKIDDAFKKRNAINPDLSDKLFKENKSGAGWCW